MIIHTIKILLIFAICFSSFAEKRASHIQKYYTSLFLQKNNLSDMYYFGKILQAKEFYPLWSFYKLNIAIFIGSDDAKGIINQYKKLALLKILQEECFTGIYACEFSKESENKLYNKNTNITIYAANSSNTENLNSTFKDSLINFDLILYMGHSRNGGGPDFSDPHYIMGTTNINYNWYKKNKPGVKLIKELIKNGNAEKVLGILSCKSNTHFRNIIKDKINLPTLLTGDLIRASNMEKVLYSTLNFFLARGRLDLNQSILSTLTDKEKLIEVNKPLQY